jgi:TRAP transporter TAXI family solute receptor
MRPEEIVIEGTKRHVWTNRLLAVIAVAAVCVTAVLWFSRTSQQRHYLTLSAGDRGGHRFEIASVLREEAKRHGLQIEVLPSRGSLADLESLAAGNLDLALVGGEVGQDRDEVRQVATLISEPLHLFARPEIRAADTASLRGKRIGTGGALTGTHRVALKVMTFIGLKAGVDFTEVALTPSELTALPLAELPDAFFVLSPLPWTPASKLVREGGYRLLELPFGDALSLSDREVRDVVIPSYSYSVDPPVPAKPLHTVATPMLMVANRHVSTAAIERLLEVLFEADFARRASLPPLDPRAVLRLHDFRLHPGTLAYLKRDEPIVNGEVLGTLENLRSFLVSAAVSLFLLWRWYRSRQLINFETYFDAVSAVEHEALRMANSRNVDDRALADLWQRLATIKAEVLEKHAGGNLNGEEQLMSFLIHVADVRAALGRLTSNPAQAAVDETPPPSQPVPLAN